MLPLAGAVDCAIPATGTSGPSESILSGDSNDDVSVLHTKRAADAGFGDHLTKPVDFDRLGAIAARCTVELAGRGLSYS